MRRIAARLPLALLTLALARGDATLAQSCPNPPLFDVSGPICSGLKQNLPCACSECIVWDASAGAVWYEVRRCNAGGGLCVITGDTRWRNRPGVSATMWCAAWDAPFPVSGVGYDYSVRACKDGPSGPICALSLSNAVRYVGAPYLCVEGGLEVSCLAQAVPLASFDADADGILDGPDLDDDGDGLADLADNCPLQVNPGQRDADADGIGDVCDPEPRAATAGGADSDGDGIADRVDVCAYASDPAQADTDVDRIGDACDNCLSKYNEMQSDSDADGEGDRCDVDDTLINALWKTKTRFAWEPERGFTSWALYRGDLAELRRSATYTQAPGSNPLAARWCSISATEQEDATLPASGAAAFYLVAGSAGVFQGSLGPDGNGATRPNILACP